MRGGIASDDLILWPTQSATSKCLWLLDPDDGRPAFVPQPRIPGVAGNLAFADGVLLVATETELWGYVFDRKPPFVIGPQTGGNGEQSNTFPSVYDALGRYFSISGRLRF